MEREAVLSLAAGLGAAYRILPPEQFCGGKAGVFAGSRDGQSVDFHDYREYAPGDDLRRVDWRAYARTGQMHLKLFREEVSPVVELHLDASASMGAYPGKEQAAVFLAAFLREAALAADARPVLCLDGRRFSGPDFLHALMAAEFAGPAGSDKAPPPSPAARPLRFFLSDFLFDANLPTLFRRHAAGAFAFKPLMLLSRSELHPPWRGFHRLRDVENPGISLDLSLDDRGVETYRRRLAKHEEALAAEAVRHGGGLLRLDAPDEALERADGEAMIALLARERMVAAK